MKVSHRWFAYFTLQACLALLTGCYKEQEIVPGEGYEDWSTATHGSSATPDYDVVFNQTQVNRLDIVISEDNWDVMMDDLEDLYGGSTGMGPGQFSDETPVTVPCSMFMDDIEWYQVGIRFKGNSSLQGSYSSGNGKLPLRLDTDTYGNIYPELNGQTFYGFEEISLANNYEDNSLIREKVTCDLFRDAGIAAPQTAFYRIYVDVGAGAEYWGLYTMVEVVFDQMLSSQFTDGSGNCYKPDGDAASFEEGSYSESELGKKTNEDLADWSDIEGLYNAINDDSRQNDSESWKNNLEEVLNVDQFLLWLAANATFQNWDTYGRMTHNYYLYNDPSTGKFSWIPWDNNEALQDGKMGGSLDLDMNEVGSDWPLINYLLAEDEYREIYNGHLQDIIDGAFDPSTVQTKYQEQYDLIEPYVTGSDGERDGYTFLSNDAEFSSALSELKSHVSDRKSEVESYLSSQ